MHPHGLQNWFQISFQKVQPRQPWFSAETPPFLKPILHYLTALKPEHKIWTCLFENFQRFWPSLRSRLSQWRRNLWTSLGSQLQGRLFHLDMCWQSEVLWHGKLPAPSGPFLWRWVTELKNQEINIYRGFSICTHVDLKLGSQMSRLNTIDKRCSLFDHCIEFLA